MNAPSVADRRNKALQQIARQSELWVSKIQPYGKPSKFLGGGLAVLLGGSHVKFIYVNHLISV